MAASVKKQIALNTVTGWLTMACRMALAVVLVPVLIEKLGKDGYGLIGLMGVIIGLSDLIDVGLRQALGRELSEKVAKNDVQGFRSLSTTALVLYSVIAAFLILANWIAAPWFGIAFKIADHLKYDSIWLIRLYGSGSIALSFITPVFRAGLQSFMRFDAVNGAQALTSVFSGTLLIVSISRFTVPPLLTWAIIMFSAQLLDMATMAFFYRRWCYNGVLSLRYLDVKAILPLIHLGGYMYILQLTNALAERSDPLVVSFFFGTAGVALYQSGAKISTSIRPLLMTLSSQIHPLTTRYHVRNESGKQRQALVLGTRYTLLPGVIVSAGILLFSEHFCRLWLSRVLGNDYLTVSRIMRLYAIADIAQYAAAMHWPALLGMKKMKFVTAIMALSSLLYILVSVYLAGFTKLGISGVLYAALGTSLLRRPVVIWYICKITQMPLREYIRSAYCAPAFLFLLLICFHFILRTHSIANWRNFILWGSVYSTYALVLVFAIEARAVKGLFVSNARLQCKSSR